MQKPNRFLRILAVVLLSLSAPFTLLGGAGTTCIAFRPENFGAKWAPFIAIKPIMQVLVVVSLLAGVFGVYAIVKLARGRRGAYTWAVAFLLVAGLASAVQYSYSLALRGSTAPNNMRLYVTLFTLAVLLLMRLPGIWQRTGFEGKMSAGDLRSGGGLALILCGGITLTTPLWAAPTHLVDGYNTANVLFWPLTVGGLLLLAAGAALLIPRTAARRVPVPAES